MYSFKLSINKTHCCSCSDGAGERFSTNIQQDQHVPLFRPNCQLLLHGDLFVKDKVAFKANVPLIQNI